MESGDDCLGIHFVGLGMDERDSGCLDCRVVQFVLLVVGGGVVLDGSTALELHRVSKMVSQGPDILLHRVVTCIQRHSCGQIGFFVAFAHGALGEKLVIMTRAVKIVIDC